MCLARHAHAKRAGSKILYTNQLAKLGLEPMKRDLASVKAKPAFCKIRLICEEKRKMNESNKHVEITVFSNIPAFYSSSEKELFSKHTLANTTLEKAWGSFRIICSFPAQFR